MCIRLESLGELGKDVEVNRTPSFICGRNRVEDHRTYYPPVYFNSQSGASDLHGFGHKMPDHPHCLHQSSSAGSAFNYLAC